MKEILIIIDLAYRRRCCRFFLANILYASCLLLQSLYSRCAHRCCLSLLSLIDLMETLDSAFRNKCCFLCDSMSVFLLSNPPWSS